MKWSKNGFFNIVSNCIVVIVWALFLCCLAAVYILGIAAVDQRSEEKRLIKNVVHSSTF
jgi:hypothetical protein